MAHGIRKKDVIAVACISWVWAGVLAAAERPLCLYVGSYHPGYHWNDGIERGLARGLGQDCRLKSLYLDSLRDKHPNAIAAKARAAANWIAKERPEVVIACDDPSSIYLVKPYLKDAKTPVVFCGINWTVEPYGYPYANTTGMIEVAPIRPLLKEALRLRPKARRLTFITADVPTQRKEAEYIAPLARQLKLELELELVSDFDAWRRAFLKAQGSNLLILGNPEGIAGWDATLAHHTVNTHTSTLTLSFGVAMSSYAVLSMINVPEEQGEWSAQLVKAILKGTPPSELPIVSNRRWQLLARPELAHSAGLQLPESILLHAKRPTGPRAFAP